MTTDFPVVVTAAGAQPTPPATLLAKLIALVAATNPGYTATLPGSLVEDISSTDVGALTLIDQARIELVNSLTPFGANEFLLNQLGQIYGVPLGQDTNTSVPAVFTGTPGFVIAVGFTISDGSHQYTVQDGGIIGSGGTSPPLFALATQPGSWAVPQNSVNQLITSVPSGISLTVNNPSAGTSGSGTESAEDYRAQVLQAGLAASQGMPRYLKTLLGNIPGVQSNLVSVQAQVGGGWKVLVGGGDPDQIANAIFAALFDVSTLVGSQLLVTGITNANPGVVATNLNHGFANGQVITIAGEVGMTGINGVPFTIAVVDQKHFSIGLNTTSLGAWTSGGVVSPNLRNVAVSITDFPDTYQIIFVNPPQQTVAMTLTWNTTAANFVNTNAVAQLGAPAVAAYINAIAVGAPINLFAAHEVFQEAIASVLPGALLTRMVFTVSINGIVTAPTAGTGIIPGDPESYFFTTAGGITVVQG